MHPLRLTSARPRHPEPGAGGAWLRAPASSWRGTPQPSDEYWGQAARVQIPALACISHVPLGHFLILGLSFLVWKMEVLEGHGGECEGINVGRGHRLFFLTRSG